jgi:hypothetical protein
MPVYQLAAIWRRLRARGYHKVTGGRTAIEVRELVPGEEFRVCFVAPGSPVGQLQGTYEQVLAQIAQLPQRREGDQAAGEGWF